jgi:hypothetical protein
MIGSIRWHGIRHTSRLRTSLDVCSRKAAWRCGRSFWVRRVSARCVTGYAPNRTLGAAVGLLGWGEFFTTEVWMPPSMSVRNARYARHLRRSRERRVLRASTSE